MLYYRYRGGSQRTRKVPLTFIPYYAWANRQATSMQVWNLLLPAQITEEGIHHLRRTRERPWRGNMKCNGMPRFWISTHAGESRSCRWPALSSGWY
jgi:hypothetical protein